MNDPPRKIALIANPGAGKGRGAEALQTVETRLRSAGLELQIHQTGGAGDGVRLARDAQAGGADVVVAIGGDATLHEVLNGILDAPRTDEAAPPPLLGVVPVGTGNDYAKMLGVPGRDPARAAEVLVNGDVWTVDVGKLEGGDQGPEYFCNNVGLAFMATANAAHEKTRRLPGRLSYALGGVLAYVAFKAETLTIDVDGVSIRDRFMIVHIGLGKYCGGGVLLTPDAKLDNGRLDVCLVHCRSKIKGFLQWPRMSSGERLEDMAVLFGRRVRVLGPRNFLLHADGENRRVPGGVLEVRLLQGGLRVLRASAPVRPDR